MRRYAEHEYYAELPFRPKLAAEKTSYIEAEHLYYWDGGNYLDGWNAFVINYEESDISPYKVIHLGTVNNANDLCAYLRKAEKISESMLRKNNQVRTSSIG